MERPSSIVWFERCYLGATAIGLVNTVLSWQTMAARLAATPRAAEIAAWFLPATVSASLIISALLWFFIARRQSNIARWIATILLAIGASAVLIAIATNGAASLSPLGIVALVLQIIAIFMLFRPDTKSWFGE